MTKVIDNNKLKKKKREIIKTPFRATSLPFGGIAWLTRQSNHVKSPDFELYNQLQDKINYPKKKINNIVKSYINGVLWFKLRNWWLYDEFEQNIADFLN